jgi:hypothetical protein
MKQSLDEGGAPIDEDIPAVGLLQRGDVSRYIPEDMAVVPLRRSKAPGYDIFR